MSLTPAQITQLREAITGYTFPAVYCDFNNGHNKIKAQNMTKVEAVIAGQLRSQKTIDTKHGLANILYWGYAKIGFGGIRVDRFLRRVSDKQIRAFQDLVSKNNMPTMMEIKRTKMPEYSGVSFISKILMFLNPNTYCVLDKQIKLRNPACTKILNGLVFKTQIRVTVENENVYNGWREECSEISQKYFQGRYRVVDIERGFFNLIQSGHLSKAQAIYNDA